MWNTLQDLMDCYAYFKTNFAWASSRLQVGVSERAEKTKRAGICMESSMKKTKRQNLHSCCPVPGFMGLDGCA